jgi:hypothetical protein
VWNVDGPSLPKWLIEAKGVPFSRKLWRSIRNGTVQF